MGDTLEGGRAGLVDKGDKKGPLSSWFGVQETRRPKRVEGISGGKKVESNLWGEGKTIRAGSPSWRGAVYANGKGVEGEAPPRSF